jgi:hypothetical protein
MGIRFRRSKKILPGVRMNVSKSGLSFTFGGKYLKTNIGHKRVTNTVRTPVKGLSFSSRKSLRTKSRKGSAKSLGRGTRKNTSSSGGLLGLLGGMTVFACIIAFGVVILYLAIIAVLICIAVTYYKANRSLDPDQVERLASIIYPDLPDKRYSAWKMYLKSRAMMKSLPKEIGDLENMASLFDGEDPSALSDILYERERKKKVYQALMEISSEPDFYQQEQLDDTFFRDSFLGYIERTFVPVYMDAENLKTKWGKKNRYMKYMDRFRDCYDYLPAEVKYAIGEYMSRYDIHFTAEITEQAAKG